MRREPIAAVALALALLSSQSSVATGTAQPAQRKGGTIEASYPKEVIEALRWLDPYLEIVRTYRVGNTESALEALRAWWNTGTASVSWTRLQTISRATKAAGRSGTGPPPLSADLIAAAIMLHTDAGLEALEAGDEVRAPEHIGRAVVLAGGFAGLLDTEAGGATDDLAARFARRAWFQGVAQTLQGLWKINAANAVVDAALEQLRQTDPAFLLAAGSVKEALAFGLAMWPDQASNIRTPEAFGRATRVSGDPAVHRRKAIELFQRALAADPESHEAGLRLGRVLCLLNRFDEGAQALEALLAHEAHAEPQLMYLAHLFFGGTLERRGRLPEALNEYRAAVAIDPKAQAARVALARALELSGDADAVLPILRLFLDQGGLRDPAEDPWWFYPFGRPDEGLRVLEMLRDAVTER